MSRTPLQPVGTWPDAFATRYREAGLWTDETFVDLLLDRCERFADRTALVGRDVRGTERRWSYDELGRRAAAAHAALLTAGVEPGDRVVIALPNVVEHLAVVLGILRSGALPVFGLPTHRERELAEFCAAADAAALVLAGEAPDADHVELHAEVGRRVAERGVEPPVLLLLTDLDLADHAVSGLDVPEPATVAASAVAFLQLSGGTTGTSKLIPRTHADYLYSVRASAEICGTDVDTRMLVVLPMAHNFSMSSPGVLGVLHAGGTVVLAHDPSPRTAFALVAGERVTTVALVPPLAQAWIAAARRRRPDLATLQEVQVGGAKLAPAVAVDVAPVLGARLQQVFGMAEGLVNYTRHDDPDELVLTTQGRPISPYDEVRVVDGHGHDVPDGEEGELLTRGPYTIRSYYRAEQANLDSFTEDGFYRTGDLVRRLPSGHLRVTGRVKDQINRSGEKIATVEVEEPLLEHPEVHDVLALGVPDTHLGEALVVVVVPDEGAARDGLPDRLRAHLQAHGLATFKMPDRFVLLEAFPATHVGKNSRRDLRAALAAQLTGERPAAPTLTAQPGPHTPGTSRKTEEIR